jgi:biopolymer transport protein ExbB
MKLCLMLVAAGLLTAASCGSAAESFDEAMHREAAVYRDRQREAAEALQRVRDRVATEKVPLLRDIREAQDRLLQAQTETRRIETDDEHAAEQRRHLVKEIDDFARSAMYVQTLAHDALKATQDALPPGEPPASVEQLGARLQALEAATPANRTQSAVDAADALLTRLERSLGGRTAPGKSLLAGDNELRSGTFVFLGPETYFRSDDGMAFGLARRREGSAYPTTFPAPGWKSTAADALFASGQGDMPLDASGGKALRLAETKGSVWDHVKKGGLVAFAILAAGLASLVMIIQKSVEILRLKAPRPELLRGFFSCVSKGEINQAQAIATSVPGAMGELLRAGLAEHDSPKAVVEEVLDSILLEQRLRYERRLPLLAVIATAAPLMGLLGTVVGMVRTFALITVFGTGNAGKLSSGISEVLVATELGLLVAIPTLVAHGFLAHRIHKHLAVLEKAALEFVTALERRGQERDERILAK